MSYFAIERNGEAWDHVDFADNDGNIVFTNYLQMSYDEMKSQEDLNDFVVAVMDAINSECNSEDAESIITLIDDNDLFTWSILMGPGENDDIRYVLIDWKKDGKNYRYEN